MYLTLLRTIVLTAVATIATMHLMVVFIITVVIVVTITITIVKEMDLVHDVNLTKLLSKARDRR